MKRNIKAILFILLIVLIGLLVKYLLFSPNNEENLLTGNYPNYIGYINQDKTLLNKEHQLCGEEDPKIYMTYNGAALLGYKKGKNNFRKELLSKYKTKNYSDSGYLNFRFLVNCKGQAGWFEIIEMDLNLEETDLNDDMINQLLELTANNEWTHSQSQNPFNYYTYISYRIENGEITEIIP